MDISFFFKGLVIGISIAAPVGPIGLLCIQRTLAQGRSHGFVSGIGAATADAVYASIAGFGLTFLSGFLVKQEIWFRLIGGAFLFYLGVRSFLSRPPERSALARSPMHVGAYVATFFLTLTNPMTILSFSAIFSGFGIIRADADYVSATMLVLGVFLGSGLWWWILSSLTNAFREKFTHSGLLWVNRTAGVIIMGFGIIALSNLLLWENPMKT